MTTINVNFNSVQDKITLNIDNTEHNLSVGEAKRLLMYMSKAVSYADEFDYQCELIDQDLQNR